jgi:hypothetical protein
VSDGGREWTRRRRRRTVVLRKKNPKIDIIQLSSLAFLNIQSVEYFGKEKHPQVVYN